ncbi:MAG: CoA-binding protein [Thermodesulfobacteriota bacterium]|nr:CoA-binding protein [Thermodesulfobacteriota bacterium]
MVDDTIKQIDDLFYPKSIAMVGIPSDPHSPVAELFLNPIFEFDFEGEVYPVNPKGGEIMGMKAYPTLNDIPNTVDYVIATIPAHGATQLMRDCVTKGVKAVQFFTSGFSETGEQQGKSLELEITEIARKGGVRIIGPNCMGLYCPKGKLSYWSEFPKEHGSVAYLCQSGGNSIHLVQMGAPRGIRFSKVASYGNASDLNESDFLDYFAQDPETEIICLYIEGVRQGQRFVDALTNATRKKPVILLKGGVAEAGARAAASHTGALTSSNNVWDALCKKLGIIRVYSLEELSDVLVTFCFMPALKRGNTAIVGVGGGASVLAADDCENNGLAIPQFPKEIRDRLLRFTPQAGNSVKNPIDSQLIIWDPEHFLETIKIISEWDGIDLIIGLLLSTDVYPSWTSYQNMYEIMAKTMLVSHKSSKKPIAMVIQPGIRPKMNRETYAAQQEFVSAGMPVYPTASRAANAIKKHIEYNKWKEVSF